MNYHHVIRCTRPSSPLYVRKREVEEEALGTRPGNEADKISMEHSFQ